MSHLYFNEESDYSEENTCDNEVFCTTILHHRRKVNIFTLQLSIYYIQYQNRKSRLVQIRTLQKLSEINRLSLLRGGCNTYIDAIKIQERERSISQSSFYRHYLHVLTLSTLDEIFLFLVQLNETRRMAGFISLFLV